jgi:hypothetical protein
MTTLNSASASIFLLAKKIHQLHVASHILVYHAPDNQLLSSQCRNIHHKQVHSKAEIFVMPKAGTISHI